MPKATAMDKLIFQSPIGKLTLGNIEDTAPVAIPLAIDSAVSTAVDPKAPIIAPPTAPPKTDSPKLPQDQESLIAALTA